MSTGSRLPNEQISAATIGMECCRAGLAAIEKYTESFSETWEEQRASRDIRYSLKEHNRYEFQGTYAETLVEILKQNLGDQPMSFQHIQDFKMFVEPTTSDGNEPAENSGFRLHIIVKFVWQSKSGGCSITTGHHHETPLYCSKSPATIDTSKLIRWASFVRSGWLLKRDFEMLCGDADHATQCDPASAWLVMNRANNVPSSLSLSMYDDAGGSGTLSRKSSLDVFHPFFGGQVTGIDQTVSQFLFFPQPRLTSVCHDVSALAADCPFVILAYANFRP
jgi:hypothetical protein